MLTEYLENRWVAFAKSLGADPKMAEKVWLDLAYAYDMPVRMYHTLSHIDSCLRTMDRLVPPSSSVTKYVEMALWWHDFVYIPGRKDNEERSMDAFVKYGRRMGFDERFIADVADMIPYTKHGVSTDGLADRYLYLLDADLSILGKQETVFDAYEEGVRFEYNMVPENMFRAGRAKILQQFLTRPFLYETSIFRVHFEKKARENLSRSIAKLTS